MGEHGWDGLFKYRFYLSFENAYCDDYSTEKSFKGLRMSSTYGLIPLVYGGGNYLKIMPPDSFLSVTNFSSVNSLATHLKQFRTPLNDTLKNFYQWQFNFSVDFSPVQVQMVETLCEQLLDSNNVTKFYNNIQPSTLGHCSIPGTEIIPWLAEHPYFTLEMYSFYSNIRNLENAIVFHPFAMSVLVACIVFSAFLCKYYKRSKFLVTDEKLQKSETF